MTTAVGPVPQSTEIQQLAISQLVPHPANRKQFDPKKLEELTASIAKSGVHTPLIVRRWDFSDSVRDPVYQIVAGERRWRAATMTLKLTTVPCIVRELTDDEALELLLTENLQREDPHPLEEADAYAAWLERPGHDVKELAARIGKSVPHVYSRLQLRQLTEGARQAIVEQNLPIGHALLLARLPAKQQDQAAAKLALESWRGVPSLKAFTRDIGALNPHLDDATFDTKDATLCPSAGACTTCPKRLGFTDGMFPELAQILNDEDGDSDPNQCLDADCFQEKTDLHLETVIAKARRQHGDALVLVSWKPGDKWPAKPTGIHPRGLWALGQKGKDGSVPAIVVKEDRVWGDSSARLGDQVWVKLKPRPKAGAKEQAAAPARPSWEVDEEKRKAKAAIEMPRRLAVAQAIMAKVPAKLDLDLVKWAVMGTFQGWQLTLLAKQLGIAAPKPEKSDAELNRALVLDMVGTDLNEYDAGRGAEMQELPKLAKRFGVDLKKVLADHDAKVAAAAKASPAAKDAPKKRAGDVARAKKAKKGGR